MAKLPVPILSYSDLRERADEFLAEHHPAQTLPIPIEQIAEGKMDVSIVIQEYLREECETDAFISHDCSTIYIDRKIYMHHVQHRSRFSIAHELAHLLLHRPVMELLQGRKTGDL